MQKGKLSAENTTLVKRFSQKEIWKIQFQERSFETILFQGKDIEYKLGQQMICNGTVLAKMGTC